MNTVKIHFSDSVKTLTSKSGKPFTITNAFVFLPNQPYPSEIGLLNVPSHLLGGLYQVGIVFNVYQGRLSLDYDFSNAKKVEK